MTDKSDASARRTICPACKGRGVVKLRKHAPNGRTSRGVKVYACLACLGTGQRVK